MQRLALPLQNGSLCQHFGKAPQVLIVNIENGTVVSEEILTAPEHAHGSMPNFLKANSVTDVLCGGIGDGALQMLREMNIGVNAGAPSQEAHKLIADYLAGTIAYGDGHCKHDHCHDHEHGHEHGHSAKGTRQFKLDL